MIDLRAPNLKGRPVVITFPSGCTVTGRIEEVKPPYVRVRVNGRAISAAAKDLSWPQTETIPQRRAME